MHKSHNEIDETVIFFHLLFFHFLSPFGRNIFLMLFYLRILQSPACPISLFLNPEMVLSQLILLIVGQEGVFTPRVSLSSGYLIPSDFLLGFFLHDAGGD